MAAKLKTAQRCCRCRRSAALILSFRASSAIVFGTLRTAIHEEGSLNAPIFTMLANIAFGLQARRIGIGELQIGAAR